MIADPAGEESAPYLTLRVRNRAGVVTEVVIVHKSIRPTVTVRADPSYL